MSQHIETAAIDLFDALPVPAFSFDVEGVLLRVNRAAADALEAGPDSVAGHRCQIPSRLSVGDVPHCSDGCPVMRLPLADPTEAEVSGPRYVLRLSLEDEGSVVVGQEVSEWLELISSQEVLLSTTAHELKTPLTSIKAMSELMLEFELPANKQRELTRDILAQSERLQRLINDILDVARMESGRITYTPSRVNLREVVDRVVDDLRQTEGQDREVSVEAPANLPEVIGEEGKVHQIVMNLTSNALKYSPMDAGVELRLRHDSEAGDVVLDVTDHGVGIAEEDLPHIFSKFYRSEHLKARKVPGTGLGLFIVRNLIELQGGSIAVKSTRGEGSTFSVRLRAAEAA
jgi:signal transduction histidine kinase